MTNVTGRLLLTLLALLVPGRSLAAGFTDLADSRYREAITLMQEQGLLSGFADGSFRPTQAMTRAEFLSMTLLAAGLQDTGVSGQCLAAFPASTWYAPVVCQGLALGLLSGEPEQTRPQNTITYAEALKIVAIALDFAVMDGGEVWYEPYVDFAAQRGILSVLEYRPNDFVTREVAANILYRSLVAAGDIDTRSAVASEPEPAPEQPPEPGSVPVPEPEPVPVTAATTACTPGQVPAAPGSLLVAGRERSLLTHLPASLGNGNEHALVVAFHGRTNSNAQVQRYMRLDANAGDAVVVYPAGMPAGGGARNWNDPGDPALELRDYQLFDRIVAEFTELYCIDPERIFVVGHSLGAYFANSLACARAHVVRAVATVAGGTQNVSCTDSVAALLLHNPNDTLVPIDEGERAREVFLAANGAAGLTPRSLDDEFNCVVYLPSNPEESVTWCPHGIDRPYGDRYDPHSWPPALGHYVMEFFGGF